LVSFDIFGFIDFAIVTLPNNLEKGVIVNHFDHNAVINDDENRGLEVNSLVCIF